VVKPPLRTKTLGTKVSEEQFAQLEAAASERGLTLSEWCRETLLASVKGEGEKSADHSSASAGPARRRSWRSWWRCGRSCSNVLFKQANGQTITAEEIQRLIDRRVAQVSPGLRGNQSVTDDHVKEIWKSQVSQKLYPPSPCLTPSATTVPAIFALSLLVATTVSLFLRPSH
jgi:hypothetical protein